MTASDYFTPLRLLKALLALMLPAVWWRQWPIPGGVGPAIGWTVATVILLAWIAGREKRARERFIDAARLPPHLRGEVRQRYPALSETQLDDVERGLRQFFRCHLHARRFVSMPSQAVDALWHAFILDTRAYQRFCRDAFGRFLHHSPAQTLGRDARRNDGLRRTWFHACRQEGIDPRVPAALPLLFALDTALAIPDGFRYEADCRRHPGEAGHPYVHCGSSFGGGCGGGSSGDGHPGDAAGFGGEAGGSSGGSDGGGDGGGGCGGD